MLEPPRAGSPTNATHAVLEDDPAAGRAVTRLMVGSALVALSASVASVAIGFLTSVVVARSLGPAGKGAYDLAIATATFLALVLGLGIPGGIAFVVARGLAGRGRMLALAAMSGIIQGVAAWLILTAAGAMPIGGVVGPASADPSGVLAVSALAASVGAAAALKAILIGAQRVGRAAWLDAAGRGLVLAVLLGVVVLVAASDPATLVATSAIAAAAALLIYLPSVFRLPTGPPSFGIRTLIGFAGPSYVANVLQFLNYRLDLFLVAYFRDLREVGLYALAAMLAQLIWLGSTATAAVVFSRTATVDEDPHAAASRTALLSRSVVLVGAAAGSVLALISPALIEVVFGAEFVDAARAIALLMPGVVLFGATNVMAGHLAGEGRPALNAGVSAASLVVTVALDLLLIPEFGMAGAAVASSAAYVSATVVMAWLFRRSTGIGMRMTLVPRVPDLERIRREVRAR